MALKQTDVYPKRNRYDGYASISKLKMIGYFSIDKERKFHDDHSSLRYLKLPTAPYRFDLNQGFKQMVPKPEQKDALLHMHEYIMEKRMNLQTMGVNFNCYRGLLKAILVTPYEQKIDWCICATKYKGVIYLTSERTTKHIQNALESQNNERSLKLSFYGYKFEQCILVDDPSYEPDLSQPVNNCVEFCGMFMAKIAAHRIMYGAEIDGVKMSKNIDEQCALNCDQLDWTEVKVTGHIQNDWNQRTFENLKLRNWWAQSMLVGVEHIYYGIRSDSGFVDQIQQLVVDQIPNGVRWSPTVCINFCKRFLDLVDYEMRAIDCPHTVFKFSFDPEADTCIRMAQYIGPNETTVITDSYIKYTKDLFADQKN